MLIQQKHYDMIGDIILILPIHNGMIGDIILILPKHSGKIEEIVLILPKHSGFGSTEMLGLLEPWFAPPGEAVPALNKFPFDNLKVESLILFLKYSRNLVTLYFICGKYILISTI
jgi:hypothetical protein